MSTSLSKAQQKIVYFAIDQGHMLVEAAPGSGKTRVISERIAYLLEEHLAQPEQIVAMTFTEEAARHLLARLEGRLGVALQGIKVGTIHNICNRLLGEHAKAVGLKPSFKIFDARRQEDALYNASLAIGRPLDKADLFEQREQISKRKRNALIEAIKVGRSELIGSSEALDRAYHEELRANNALDFDDLIIYACQLLRNDRQVAELVQEQVRFVFVDEFHDLSPDQMAFLQLLAPCSAKERAPFERQVMVVADPNQAIYGWRDAYAAELLRQYHRYYRPQLFRLGENYRSSATIVAAASKLINAGGAASEMRAIQNGTPQAIRLLSCSSEWHEARLLVDSIKALCGEGKRSYSDIAVLYRSNWRAKELEIALLRAGIPIQRHQQDRFFDQADVQATLRYLSLILALEDEHFEPTLFWPRVLVDELSMAQLQRLAAREGIAISTLARNIDRYAEQVSPLTRTIIRDFLTLFDRELARYANQPIDVIVPQLLAVLKRHRNPLSGPKRDELRASLKGLRRALAPAVDQLVWAVKSRQPICISHTGSLDSASGAVILRHILKHYLNISAQILPANSPLPAKAFVVRFGQPQAPNGRSFGISQYSSLRGTLRFSISTQAWCIGQMLLMSYEQLRNERYVVFDLETTGVHVNSTEVLELAAVELANGQQQPRFYHELSKPKGRISPEAIQVHGISEQMVRDKPPIEELLPSYVAFLGDANLVGHNVANFDYPIIRRLCEQLKIDPPSGPVIDTFALARRLLPDQSHRLQELARYFGINEVQTHRALDDVRMNALVFQHLVDLLDEERELDIAPELLSLVALGIYNAGFEHNPESETLLLAAARAHATAQDTDLLYQVVDLLPDSSVLLNALQRLETLRPYDDNDDRRWKELAERWAETLEDYKRHFEDHSLRAFLEYVALASNIDSRRNSGQRVSLSTIHAAKGKEWPIVFIIGLEEGVLPDRRIESDEDLAEERRVFYVAMTRAQEQLVLSFATSSRNNRARQASRFLNDLPRELIRRGI